MTVISEFSEPKHSKNNRGSVLGMTNTYIKFQVIGFNGSPETVRKRMACGGGGPWGENIVSQKTKFFGDTIKYGGLPIKFELLYMYIIM